MAEEKTENTQYAAKANVCILIKHKTNFSMNISNRRGPERCKKIRVVLECRLKISRAIPPAPLMRNVRGFDCISMENRI